MPIQIHTDGCRKATGNGGWAYILQHRNKIVVGYGYSPETTSNIMELSGPAMALDYITHHNKHKENVTIISDSTYFCNGFNSWMYNWEPKGWRLKNKDAVKNAELWKILFEQSNLLKVKAKWVRGHNGHEENEEADTICNFAVATRINQLLTFKTIEEYKKWMSQITPITLDLKS